MLRLTVRSGRDGRFLARVVDRGGFPFVLDYGDRRIIDDVLQRLLHGFTMWRHGKLIAAGPQDPEMLVLLAEFYASEGLLVAIDEPTWPDRAQPHVHEPDDPSDETDVVTLDALPDLARDLESSDDPTD